MSQRPWKCEFRQTLLEDEHVELRIVLPGPGATPCDLEGAEAIKKLAKWACAHVAGLAESQGIDMHELLYQVHQAASKSVDIGVQAAKVIEKVRAGSQSPRSLEEKPPEGMDSKTTRLIVQKLLDQGKLILDDSLCLALNHN